MKKLSIVVLALLIFSTFVFADFKDTLKKADNIYDSEQYKADKDFLLNAVNKAPGNEEKAEVYWRLARVVLNLGDQAENHGIKGNELLNYFVEGEKYADKAIGADPDNFNGYYWKSANIGRWGQTKGILNSLFKAGPMRDLLKKTVTLNPDFPDAYYVLGQLYEQVPGFPISFGNTDFAVSLGRKAVDLYMKRYKAGLEKDINYDFYTELSKHLYKRNWNTGKRRREKGKKRKKYNSLNDPFEKSLYYEGVAEEKNESDRGEAVEMIKWVINELSSIQNRKISQNDDLKEAKETLKNWGL
ncbi:MAG: hypothetical protein J7K04_13625 [Spirochaetales bacterium]|nr:hypothetical protein [Spirochaetales bacterium]